MRIGDLLLERRVLRQSELALALEEQARSGRRLCSLLISRGAIDFDDGARALGDLRGVPCALAKHLANRDSELVGSISPELGRASIALPIGRTSGGALIVAVRDPDPVLRATLEHAAGSDVMMVITPATRLEHLIAASYGASNDDFDVELDSQIDAAISVRLPPLPDIDMLDPDSMRLALSDLDDERVAKDPSQSGMITAPSSTNIRSGSSKLLPPVAPKIDSTRAALERAETRDAATELAIAFVAGRWLSGLIAVVREFTAIGYRGHSAELAGFELPLDVPSTIARAVTHNALALELPQTKAQDALVRALRNPTAVAAAPVAIAEHVVAVIAVGDSIHGPADHAAHDELVALANALGTAYERIRRR